ncbi:hypothetical protein [Gellertiella hungarica]|uniref:Uncharacterized protein n=1 Tax=Gellertiella hungarica TaxID=1572859 RepID=A0A7W6JB58_9HYPH|nr:hypothetical protein [Gellertiella hungarica]MBB4067206.1 hypothetical protein [Gellertiella hungarica]
MDLADLEARLNAHRKLLVQIMTMLAGDERFAVLLQRYRDETENVQDHQEDPGVVEPDPAFAIKGRSTEELQAMLAAALVRADVEPPSAAARR